MTNPPTPQGVTLREALIQQMVNRFLGWKLPENFGPDCYVSFDRISALNYKSWPIGTNLLTAEQAKAMFDAVMPELPMPEFVDEDLDAWHCEVCCGKGWNDVDVKVNHGKEIGIEHTTMRQDCETCNGTGWIGPDAAKAATPTAEPAVEAVPNDLTDDLAILTEVHAGLPREQAGALFRVMQTAMLSASPAAPEAAKQKSLLTLDRPVTFGGCPFCGRQDCVAGQCQRAAKPERQAQAGEPGNNKGKSNGRNDKQGPALGANLPLGGSPDASVACSTYSSLSSLTDVLWGSDDVMSLNAELGLTMDQLVRIANVVLQSHRESITKKDAALKALWDDAMRLNWLDEQNSRFKIGWKVGAAPAGNVSVTNVIQLGGKVTTIREAIDTAITQAQEAMK